ncbi:MAG: hypothetical protein ACRDH5_03475, partial [bacterium]
PPERTMRRRGHHEPPDPQNHDRAHEAVHERLRRLIAGAQDKEAQLRAEQERLRGRIARARDELRALKRLQRRRRRRRG